MSLVVPLCNRPMPSGHKLFFKTIGNFAGKILGENGKLDAGAIEELKPAVGWHTRHLILPYTM